ncbi:Spore germination protein YaaH [Bacillus sp. OV166]|uniref:LysM peptidoglycan-binding domain-containing protein n=1 Tax=Bacillus sp. OV166 TaxID=1882763 RepID=UPI000A2AC6B2|nr:LysM peptidoglycan-binding domain-containing protein [Bacillus sp. OV166]SMQ81530.1 Spore germination protein YaaH [Bacillus sp. OV166]
MNFEGFRIVTEDDQLTLVLYLDDQQIAELGGFGDPGYNNDFLTEFARELGVKRDLKQVVRNEALQYIKSRFPTLKVNTVKVMVGTMLLGSFSLLELENRAQAYTGQTLPNTTYQVKSGDTLNKIATQFNTTISIMKELNGLKTDVLYVGQSLKLPFYTYTAVSGDTLFVIAKRYNITVDHLRSANKLTSNTVYIGQKLRVPLPVESAVTTAPPVPTAPTTGNYQAYTVVPGDTLYLISKKFNTTVDAIIQLNKLTSASINVGQKLQIPSSKPAPSENTQNIAYTVVSGDTLAGISRKYGTTVTAIKTANKLTTDIINVGQRLTIPVQIQAHHPPADTTAPTVPTIITNANITKNNVAAYTITGAAETGATVFLTLTDGTNTVSLNTTADGTGKFQIATNTSALKDGTVIIRAIAQDKAGNKSSERQVTIIKDIVGPTQPILTSPTIINGTNKGSYPLTGRAEPNSKVNVTFKDASNHEVKGVMTTNSQGVFNQTFNLTLLSDGSVSIQLKANDQVGNESSMLSTNGSIDTIAPITPTLTVPSFISSTNQNGFTISGTTEPKATMEVRVSDGTNERAVQFSADNKGNYNGTIALASLKDGPVKIKAISIDRAGNAGPERTSSITKDTKANPPALTNVAYVNLATASAYLVKGTVEPNAKVIISISDGINSPVNKELQAGQDGRFQSTFDLSGLNNKALTINAYQIDQAGNRSTMSTAIVQKDTTVGAPTIGELSLLRSENVGAYTISGTAEPQAVVHAIFKDESGNMVTFDGKADSLGAYTLKTDLRALKGEKISLTVNQIDAVGNKSQESTKIFNADLKGPTILELADLPVISQASESSYEISGKSEPNSTISIKVTDGTKTVLNNVKADGQGNFMLTMNLSTLADGPLSVNLTTKDEHGNIGKEIRETVIKDTQAPNTFTFDAANDGIVNQYNADAYHITGTSPENGGIIHLEISNGTETITDTTLVVDGVYDIPVNLLKISDGKLSLRVSQKDASGNESEAKTYTIVKDTVANVPVITTSQVKNNGTTFSYTIQGSAEPNSKVQVTLAGQSGSEMIKQTLISGADGNFNGTFDISPFIKNNPFISVQQIDNAENKSKPKSIGLTSYVTGSGDTLWKIANLFGTSIDSITKLNRLTSSNIYVGQNLMIPTNAGVEVSVISEEQAFNMGYLYFGDSKFFSDTVKQTNGTINVVSPTYFDLNADGTLKLTSQVDRHFIASMHENGIRVVPFVSNHWNRAVGESSLENREKLAQQLADTIELYNLDGINVDIENVTDQYRDEYTDFVRLLREKLPAGKEVSTAVAANPSGWKSGWQGSYDYANLGLHSDYLMIMAYDESYSGSPPGPLASIGWVERSIQYALKQGVPKEKIVLGIGHYGRYWKEGASSGGYGISNQQIKQAVALYNGSVTFDEASQTPKAVFTIKEGDATISVYGRNLVPGTYTVWFENEQSIRAKMDLIKKYGIKGTGNWGVDQEVPEFWDAFAGMVGKETALP